MGTLFARPNLHQRHHQAFENIQTLTRMKKKKPSARSKKALSPTNKDLSTKEQDEHLDFSSLGHARDVEQNQEFRDWEKGKEPLKSIQKIQRIGVLGAARFPMPDKQDYPIGDLNTISPILDLRDNFCLEDQVWSQKRGSDWNAFISKERNKRSTYKEASGSIRKQGQDKFKSPLKTIFLRLPPWLASQLEAEQDEDFVKTTVCDLAETFSKETGYPIIAANIHRENENDLHVHLVYSDVIKTPIKKKFTKKRQREILAAKRKEVREELKASGLPAHSKNVKKAMDALNITFPDFEDTGKFEYRKIMRFGMGENDWPTAKRNMHILGSAYRYKGQLWEAAETEKDKEFIREFRENNAYFDGSFAQRLCKRKDPESDYLDWWLEHEFSRKIYDQLDDTRKNKADISRQRSVKNYITYGQNLINPAEIVRLDQQKELEEKASLLNEKEKQLNSEKIAIIAKKVALDIRTEKNFRNIESLKTKEDTIEKRELQAVAAESKIKKDRNSLDKTTSELKNNIKLFKQNLSHAKSEISQQQKSLAEKQTSLNKKADSIAKSESSLGIRKSQITQKEVTLNKKYHIRRNRLQATLNKAIANIKKRRATLTKDQKKFDQNKEALREEGRQEILDSLTAKISTKEPLGKSKNLIFQVVAIKLAKAKKYDKLKPIIKALIKRISTLPKCPNWLKSAKDNLESVLENSPPESPGGTGDPQK